MCLPCSCQSGGRILRHRIRLSGMKMSSEENIREFILENYLFTDDQSELNNDDSFLDQGILDSTGILEIIFFIEDEFGVKIKDDEMIPDNLDSVNKIIAFIDRKQQE